MLLQLLPEIQGQIFDYCTSTDLQILARTNSEYNELLREVLFHTIRIPQSQLEQHTYESIQRLDNRLMTLKDTKVLRLSWPCISQSTIETISTLSNLQELYLHHCTEMDDFKISLLCEGLAGLKVLDLSGTLVVNLCKNIEKLRSLEVLYLNKSKVSDNGLSFVCKLATLKTIAIRDCRSVLDVGISHLSMLIHLETLNIGDNSRITDIAIAHLSTLTSLKKLDISLCQYNITDLGMSYIGNLFTLEELNLSSVSISDDGLSYITTLTLLKKLDISFCERITDVGMSYISNLIMLEKLNMDGCSKISDSCVAHMRSTRDKLEVHWDPHPFRKMLKLCHIKGK